MRRGYGERKESDILLVAIAILFVFSGLSLAQTTEQDDCLLVDSYFRFIPAQGVEVMSGKVEVSEASNECSYKLKAFGKLPVKFSLGSQYIGIKETIPLELPAHLTALTSDYETTLPFFHFSNTYLRLGITAAFYTENWNFDTSAFRIPMRYLLIYRPNSKWTFLYGIAVYPDFENEIFPVLGFIYKPNDKLIFNILPKRPNITYTLNNRLDLFLEGGSAFAEFEVKRQNKKNVVLCYKEMHLGAGARYRLNQFISACVSFGGIFNRSLKYRDNQGKVNIDNALFTECRIEVRL